ncbi:MAG: TetR/AcrR family transcriptional regulator [Bacteroidota bacterium]
MQNNLLKKVEQLFWRYGIRSVSMDDVARELGISKKTLYQQVENKTDLLTQVLAQHVTEEQAAIADIKESASSAINELISISRYAITRLRNISASFRYDIEKYYPEQHTTFDQLQNDFFQALVQENMIRGKAEGLYRANIDEVVIAKFFGSMAKNIGMNTYFPIKQFALEHVVTQLVHYHINGIASAKGQELLCEYLDEETTKTTS